MLPMMCDQLPCMNIAVSIVSRCWPEAIFAGTIDHRSTNGSPLMSSRMNTMKLITMIVSVTVGKLAGRRDTSVNGTTAIGNLYGEFKSEEAASFRGPIA